MNRAIPPNPILFALLFAASITQLAMSQSIDPAKALAEIQQKPLSKGPHGEEPASPSSVSLTTQEIDTIKGLKAKAAIVMHYSGNDWSQAQVAGLKAQFEKMGIEVIAV